MVRCAEGLGPKPDREEEGLQGKPRDDEYGKELCPIAATAAVFGDRHGSRRR